MILILLGLRAKVLSSALSPNFDLEFGIGQSFGHILAL